jgi:hypothetical protein
MSSSGRTALTISAGCDTYGSIKEKRMRRADQRKYHYIYRIDRDDGRYYIGMHSTDDLDDGYFGSGSLLSKSIKKYGVEKHVKHILEYLPSRESLRIREKILVDQAVLRTIR